MHVCLHVCVCSQTRSRGAARRPPSRHALRASGSGSDSASLETVTSSSGRQSGEKKKPTVTIPIAKLADPFADLLSGAEALPSTSTNHSNAHTHTMSCTCIYIVLCYVHIQWHLLYHVILLSIQVHVLALLCTHYRFTIHVLTVCTYMWSTRRKLHQLHIIMCIVLQ